MNGLDYIVARYSDVKELEYRVRELIAKGWTPQGGVSIAMDNSFNKMFVQAMISTSESRAAALKQPPP